MFRAAIPRMRPPPRLPPLPARSLLLPPPQPARAAVAAAALTATRAATGGLRLRRGRPPPPPSLSPLFASFAVGTRTAVNCTTTPPPSPSLPLLLLHAAGARRCMSTATRPSGSPETAVAATLRGQPTATATAATAASAPAATAEAATATGDRALISFDDPSAAFATRTTWELARALLVFRVAQMPVLVNNAQRLIDWSDKVLGTRLTTAALRRTFFAHFCAGEDGDRIQPVIQRLRTAGLGAILDYAAESDVTEDVNPEGSVAHSMLTDTDKFRPQPKFSIRENVVSARVHVYDTERHCDANTDISLRAIDAASTQDGDGYAAIKVTALGNAKLLMHMSEILYHVRRLFRDLVADPTADRQLQANEFAYMAKTMDYDTFTAGLDRLDIPMPDGERRELFRAVDRQQQGRIDYIEWMGYVRPTHRLFINREGRPLWPVLSANQEQQLVNMTRRLRTLAAAAAEKRVRLMVDAEHSYFQPAIDHMTLQLQREYNKSEPIIFNTYQCYLRDTWDRLSADRDRARRENWVFAAKLVRGAYMVLERARAATVGYPSPIHDTKTDTDAMYNRAANFLMDEGCPWVAATHNEESVKQIVRRMQDLQMQPATAPVAFAQLLGMCDHVSYTLGRAGYRAYKYVPYGPVREVLPYLIRRAEENSSLIGGVQKERSMLWAELRRRRFGLVRA